MVFNFRREHLVKVYTEPATSFNREYLSYLFRIIANDIVVAKVSKKISDIIPKAFEGNKVEAEIKGDIHVYESE
jgi:hypothetical protein